MAIRTKLAARLATGCGGLLLVAGSSWGQPLQVPAGRWWARPRVAEELGLTDEQRSQLEATTLDHARTMVDLKATVEKAEIDLRVAADGEPFNVGRVRETFAALQHARARLESERFDMLLKVRGVLTTEQWGKLKALAKERLATLGRGDDESPSGQAAPWRVRRPRRF